VIRQHAGKYVQEGALLVPARIEIHTQMRRVTLDFTRAVITSSVLRIDADMVHGKLFIVSPPGIVISTDGLASPTPSSSSTRGTLWPIPVSVSSSRAASCTPAGQVRRSQSPGPNGQPERTYSRIPAVAIGIHSRQGAFRGRVHV